MFEVTLINPSQYTAYPQPPVGLSLIAAILEKEGYRVNLVDANAQKLQPEKVASLAAGADIVGLTAMTPTISPVIDIARHLKQTNPSQTIILGGAHATLLPHETMEASSDIDIIVRGEGDETIVELLRAISENQSLDTVSGINYRQGDNIIDTPDRTSPVDMDALPFPAYHLLSWKKYKPHPPHGLSMPFAAMVTSRGCPYHCAYCSKPVFGSKFRAQKPDRVIDEILFLKQRYGVKEIAFYDDSFTLNKDRVLAFTEKIIRTGIKFSWTCETRVNLIDKELLRNMKRAGCYAIAYGIETGSSDILKVLQKETTLEQAEKAVKITKEAGIQVIGYFMLGSPGETPEDIRRTIDFSKKLQVDFAQFAVTTPFPGTALYDIYMRDREEKIPWESFVYAGTDNLTTPVFNSDSLTRDDLKSWIKQAYREFYLRPEYIGQRLGKCTSLNQLKINFKGFTMLMNSLFKS
jgi:anaerobic magnesium-protoporphyrin IX monomethyl ester cyclase